MLRVRGVWREVEIAEEAFLTAGLVVADRGWLEAFAALLSARKVALRSGEKNPLQPAETLE